MAPLTISVTVPNLNRGDFGDAVAHVQHILNDLDRWQGVELLLNEDGQFGPKTRDRVFRFQQESRISGPTGGVGTRTWKALLEAWLPISEGE